MSNQRLTLPDAPGDFEVLLEHNGVKVKYRPVEIVRSVQRRMRQLLRELEAADPADDEAAWSEEELDRREDEQMRRVCDLVNLVVTTEAKDAPPAGDMLYEAWEADELSASRIFLLFNGLFERASGADPTRA